MSPMIELTQFRATRAQSGVLHLVFDAPRRSMNVFSDAAIADLARFVAWLPAVETPGVVISSGKASAFCAGADLDELGAAYDMIMAAPAAARHRVAFDHFFKLSSAIRGLEIAGKPVAAAIGGLALGGGCELAMGAHHRVLSAHPLAALGLPESLVGLLPGGGGTQRLPRLIGIRAALPILLNGARLSGQAALAAGLVDAVVPEGEEIAEAERWVLSAKSPLQSWDRPDWRFPEAPALHDLLSDKRSEIMAQTHGHYPAPIAILDCLSIGLLRPMDEAIRAEMAIFADLIQRREPRNMIRSLFRGKLDYERLRKSGELPFSAVNLVEAVKAAISGEPDYALRSAMARAGFGIPAAVNDTASATVGNDESLVAAKLASLRALCQPLSATLSDRERRAADYLLVTQAGVPAYLGGLFVE